MCAHARTGHLRMLGQPAHTRSRGAFYEKDRAISDIGERIAPLNRGQGWAFVIRTLRECLPRVRDNSLDGRSGAKCCGERGEHLRLIPRGIPVRRIAPI